MRVDEYAAMDGVGLAQVIRAGDVSVSEVHAASQEACDRLNPVINAVVAVAPAVTYTGTAVERSVLAGAPLLVKDNHACAGLPARHGSRFLPDIPADSDHPVVERLRRAGLVPTGMTNMPEAGLLATTEPLLYGPCRNPWALDRTTGGSSGGSAAAVIAGIAPIATASDGGGSIRIPASACGVFGLKPSRGRTPGAGWGGLAVHHVLTRTVRDSAAVLDLLSGADRDAPDLVPAPDLPFAAASDRDPRPLRIAVAAAPPAGVTLHPEVVAATINAGRLLESLGHHVVDDALHLIEPDVISVMEQLGILVPVSTAARFQQWAEYIGRPVTPADVETLTWRYLEQGNAAAAVPFVRLMEGLQILRQRAGQFFENYDLLLLPVTAEAAPERGVWNFNEAGIDDAVRRMTQYVPGVITALANITGQPAVSIPFGHSCDRVPLGVQLVAPMYREDLLIAVSAQIERAHPWPTTSPLMC